MSSNVQIKCREIDCKFTTQGIFILGENGNIEGPLGILIAQHHISTRSLNQYSDIPIWGHDKYEAYFSERDLTKEIEIHGNEGYIRARPREDYRLLRELGSNPSLKERK